MSINIPQNWVPWNKRIMPNKEPIIQIKPLSENILAFIFSINLFFILLPLI